MLTTTNSGMGGAEQPGASAVLTTPPTQPPARWPHVHASVRRSMHAVAQALNPVDPSPSSSSSSSSSSSGDDDDEAHVSHGSHRLSHRHPLSARSQRPQPEQRRPGTHDGSRGSPVLIHAQGAHDTDTCDQAPEKSTGTSADKNSAGGQPGLEPIPSSRTAEHKLDHIFDWVHTGQTGKYVAPMGPQIPLSWRHLFKPPIIRQWIHGRFYYGEVSERETSRFELVFDLIYAGLAHAAAENLAESTPSAWNVALLTFEIYLAWVIWMDQQKLVNQLGTDDIYQRSMLLFIMMMIIAYISNIRDIHIGHISGSAWASGLDLEASQQELVRQAPRFLHVWSRRVLAAAEEEGGETKFDMHAKLIGPYYFSEGWHVCLQAAMSFWFVARLFKIVLLFVWGCQLHNFRFALWLQSLITVFTSAFFLPLLFTTNTKAVMAMCLVGFLVDVNVRYLIILSQQMLHRWGRKRERTFYIPAVNIEHIMERLTLLTLVILGEAIMNTTYHGFFDAPLSESAGWNHRFGRACFAVIVSFMLCFVYFDADASRTFVHALRRHFFPSTLYTIVHFPLTVALIVMSSSLTELIPNAEVDQGMEWYYSGSLAVALCCIAFLGATHASLDQRGTSLLNRETRILARLVVAIIFALLPLKSDWRTIDYLAVHACLLIVLVAFETTGKIGAVGRVYDAQRAATLEQKRFAIKAMRRDLRLAERELDSLGVHPHVGASRSDEEVLGALEAEFSAAKTQFAHTADDLRARAQDELEAIRDLRRFQPTKQATWHTYPDLSYAERGEEDVGNEVELGKIERTALPPSRRWALASL